jgi:hypothetical protein
MICIQLSYPHGSVIIESHSHYYGYTYSALIYHHLSPYSFSNHLEIVTSTIIIIIIITILNILALLYIGGLSRFLHKKNHNRQYSVKNLLYNNSTCNSKCFFLPLHLDLRLWFLIKGLLHHFIKFIIRHISFRFYPHFYILSC